MGMFHNANWSTFYGEVEEAIPDKTTQPYGKEVELCMFAKNDKVQWRLHMGFCIFLNMDAMRREITLSI